MQESTFRSISRELHDDFGQILTAVGTHAAARRRGWRARPGCAARRAARSPGGGAVHARESAVALAGAASRDAGRNRVRERARSLPAGVREATGIAVRYEKAGGRGELDRDASHSFLSRDAGGAEQRRAAFAVERRPTCGCATSPEAVCSKSKTTASASASARRARASAWFRCASARRLVERAHRISGNGAPAAARWCGFTVPARREETACQRALKPITVLLVDDHSLVRRGFRRMLEDDPDIARRGRSRRRPGGRRSCRCELRPDVVVMDFALPSMNGAVADAPDPARPRPRRPS